MGLAVGAVGRTAAMVKPRSVTAVRLQERMDEIGVSQDQLAAAIGCTQTTISRILTGGSQNSRWLPKIAVNLAVNLNWLMGVTDQKIDMVDVEGEQISEDRLAAMRAGVIENRLQKPHQLAPAKGAEDKRLAFNGFPVEERKTRDIDALIADVVEIRELDLTFGFGATYLDVPVTETMRPFGRDFIRQHTRARPEELFFAQGIGDSMFPTLLDSDVLLIDTSQKVVNIAAKVWAVSYGGMGMVKRISPAKGGGVMLHSDNPAIPDQVAYDGELQVLGRVVAFFRKM